jgi:hypothetical protein
MQWGSREATLALRGVSQHGANVIACRAREILAGVILAHPAREILENDGRCDPSAHNTGFAAAHPGGDLNMGLPVHVSFSCSVLEVVLMIVRSNLGT